MNLHPFHPLFSSMLANEGVNTISCISENMLEPINWIPSCHPPASAQRDWDDGGANTISSISENTLEQRNWNYHSCHPPASTKETGDDGGVNSNLFVLAKNIFSVLK